MPTQESWWDPGWLGIGLQIVSLILVQAFLAGRIRERFDQQDKRTSDRFDQQDETLKRQDAVLRNLGKGQEVFARSLSQVKSTVSYIRGVLNLNGHNTPRDHDDEDDE